jgi:hypothetical protein
MAVTDTKSLVSKLAEACDEVGGIEKKGRNMAQSYDYVKAADVAKAIRHELFKRGVVIIPDEVECLNRQMEFRNAKGETRQVNEVQVKTAYVITDGAETLTMHGFGIAWDSGDKAIYKAKTGALKYFLRGLGLIPDEKDDPEADETIDKITRAEKRFSDARISDVNKREFWKEARKTGKSNDQISAYLADLGYKQTEELKQSEYDAAISWARNPTANVPKDAQETLALLNKTLAIKSAKKASEAPPDKPKRNLAKLYGAAKDAGVKEADFRQAALEIYKAEHLSTDLTDEQYEGLIEWVESQAQNA